MNYQIEKATIEDCIHFLKQIPELLYPQKPKSEYLTRFEDGKFLLLKAINDNGETIGVKVGYKHTEAIFYSWLGAIHPDYRQQGIAKLLAAQQEKWARNNGFSTIRFKTLNRHKAMLLFAIKNGFEIVDFQSKPKPKEDCIVLEKTIR